MSGDDKNLDRREFIKRLTINSALAAGAVATGFAFRSEAPGLSEDQDDRQSLSMGQFEDAAPGLMAISRGDDPTGITSAAVTALGGMSRFVSSGDTVLIKPNIGWDRRPKFAANTNPEVVASLASMCLDAGASKVVVTDSPCNNPARCFDKSGLKRKLGDLNVELLVPTERDYVEVDLGGEVLGNWPVLKVALESDRIINVPIAKHHSSAILSLGMKNWYGVLGGGNRRGRLHQEMALGIAELAERVRPVLTVMDAYRILFRNGPQGGSIKDTKKLKTVIASTDPVAVDAYTARFFDLTPQEVPYIPIAAEKGLGSQDPAALEWIEVEEPVTT